MATTTQYTCDVCGKPKGQTNHWYALYIERDAMTMWPFHVGHLHSGALHICGEACLLKKISERLGRESFALPEAMAATSAEVDDGPRKIDVFEQFLEVNGLLDEAEINREVGSR